MWALVKPRNYEVYKINKKKFSLLKQLETKEHISKKTIANFQDGSKVTVIFRKNYMKWFRDERTGTSQKRQVNEVDEVTYILKELQFKYMPNTN